MTTFAVTQDLKMWDKTFADIYELLAYISAYVHQETVVQNQLAKKLETIEQEAEDGPFTLDEVEVYLESLVSWK